MDRYLVGLADPSGLLDISVDQEVSTPSFSNMGGFATGLVLVAFYKLKTGQAIWTRGDRLRPLTKEIAGLGFL